MIIRNYEDRDNNFIRKICMDTAQKRYAKNPKLREMMCFMFLDYFVKYEKENCFVAVENDIPCGYIVCSTNIELYKQGMREFIKKINKINLIYGLFTKISINISNKLKKRFDAEFHINIESNNQGKRIGPKLLHTLAQHLLRKNKQHMFLITKNRRTRGYSFYKYFGFTEAKKLFCGSLALKYDNVKSIKNTESPNKN